MMVTLREDVSAFMIISGPFLFIMRNVSHVGYRENQSTHFVFSKVPPPPPPHPKIVPCMLEYGKIWQSQTGQRRHCNTAHALCLLDT